MTTHNISHTLVRSGVTMDTRELVLACGYSVSGKYGYFICWEQVVSGSPQYDDSVFFEKETEKSYTKALEYFGHIATAYKR